MASSILVINSGSSSLKFSVISTEFQKELLTGLAEKLGKIDASISFKYNGNKKTIALVPNDHAGAVAALFNFLSEKNLAKDLTGVGHRVVHGGEQFKTATLITAEVLAAIEACVPFAPLHNPANLVGIQVAMKTASHLPQVAVFDTSFHQTIPEHAYLYAVPMEWYRNYGVRKYGFHGTSHQYVCQQAARMLSIPIEESSFISAHLGNGASAAAVHQGKSMDTTMGFTPLEGLVMGTRSGNIDPGLVPYLSGKLNIHADEVVEMLNKRSGLLGLSELSNDMRELTQAALDGHKGATIAIEVFAFRLAKSIGALSISLPKIDALVFTGGIGENAPLVRSKVLQRLKVLGFCCDEIANAAAIKGKNGLITTPESTKALVVCTNEEAMIVQQTLQVLNNKSI